MLAPPPRAPGVGNSVDETLCARFDLIFLLAHIIFFKLKSAHGIWKPKKKQEKLMREKIKPECYSTYAFTDMTLELLKGMQRQLFRLQTDKKTRN